MRKSVVVFFILISLLFISCDSSGITTTEYETGDLISAKLIKVLPALSDDEKSDDDIIITTLYGLAETLSDAGLEEFTDYFSKLTCFINDGDGIKYSSNGVAIYKINYATKGYGDSMTTASAVVMVPMGSEEYRVPILSIQRPTITKRSQSPSQNAPLVSSSAMKLFSDFLDGVGNGDVLQLFFDYEFARAGYMVVVADMLGFGDNRDVHPYCNKFCAESSLDAIKAAMKMKKANKKESVFDGEHIALLGFSEGGYTTMQLHKIMEEKGMNVTASACCDGPYSISDCMRRTMVNMKDKYPEPYYFPLTVSGLKSLYADNPVLSGMLEYDNVFSAEKARDVSYPGTVKYAAESGMYTGKEITELMKKPFVGQFGDDTPILKLMTDDAFYNSLEDSSSFLAGMLKEHDAFNWVPQSPLIMIHLRTDDLVDVENAEIAFNGFRSADAGENVQKDIFENGVGVMEDAGVDNKHTTAFPVAIMKGFKFIDSKVYNRDIFL